MASLSLVYVGFLVFLCSESALSTRVLLDGVGSSSDGVAVKRLIPIRPPKRAVMEPAWTSIKAPETEFAGFGDEHDVRVPDVADNGEPAPPDGSVPRVRSLAVSRLLPLPFDAVVHENNVPTTPVVPVHKHGVYVLRQPPRSADVVHVNNVPTTSVVPVHKHGVYVLRQPPRSADVVHVNNVPTTPVVPVHKHMVYVPCRPPRSADVVHENDMPTTPEVPVHKHGIYVPRRPPQSADIVHENAKPSPFRPGNK